ncbi:MAG: hypothetical protein WC753_00545 [Candidatus Gracilibacteria bacterium]|jgi:hypothetical protein
MKHQVYRGPYDPVPKWEKRNPVPPQVPEDPWEHIPRTADQVTKLASPLPKTPNIQESAITDSERFIVYKLMGLPERERLILACRDPSGEQFLALSASVIDEVKNVIEGETIHPEHVLFLLRKELKITIS